MATLRVGVIHKIHDSADRLRSKDIAKTMAKKVPEFYNTFLASHNAHQESLKKIKQLLKKNQIEYKLYECSRGEIPTKEKFDLWISLGGDGTFLYSSHIGDKTPILGINSSPKTSVGNFCQLNMFDHSEQIITLLRDIKNKQARPMKLERLALRVNDMQIPIPILNDILIAEENPAQVSSYFITYKKKAESHKSSGIWIASYNGSTAAYRSAGGKPFSLYDLKKKRGYAFMIREIYARSRKYLTNEIVREDDFFEIISTMTNGALYLDGHRNTINFNLGSRLRIGFHPEPLLSF